MSEIPIFKFALREDLKSNKLFLPTKGTSRSTGWDVRAAFHGGPQSSRTVFPGQYLKIPLGFRVFAPDGWWLDLHPRSSTFAKKHLHALYGVIDEDYEGENSFCCQYIPDSEDLAELVINFGDALGQIIPVQRQQMNIEVVSNDEYDALCWKRNAQRGTGGFGSTGK